ncbi:MAG: hypothetical protein ABI970_06675 [Chloroflexota bacterium]
MWRSPFARYGNQSEYAEPDAMNQPKTFNAKTQKHKGAKGYFSYAVVLCCLLFVGCIPAHVPDNLDDTPGPPVLVDNQVYQGVVFSARIPEGWRVITGEAQAAQSVIFVAPDGKTLIRLMTGKVDESAVTVADQRNEIDPVTLADATIVMAVFSSPYSTWASYFPAFEQVRDSLSSH